MKTETADQIELSFSREGCGKYHLSARQWIDRPVEEIFDFFNRPANLIPLTPPEQRMRVVGDLPETMTEGMEVTYGFRMAGLPMKWVAKLTEVQAPSGFVDTQLKGPFLSWVHHHLFEAENGGTLIRDEVDYAAPVCRIGHGCFLEPRLTKLFQFRAAALRERFPPQTGG